MVNTIRKIFGWVSLCLGVIFFLATFDEPSDVKIGFYLFSGLLIAAGAYLFKKRKTYPALGKEQQPLI